MMKEYLRNIPLIIISLVLAFFLTFILLYFNFYVHELGHANIALLSTQINQIPSVTINFTYQPLLLFGQDLGLNYPQQTNATILVVYSSLFKIAGVLFSILFWAIIFLLLAKVKVIKNNNYLFWSLAVSFIALILNDIISNLFCGTDGVNLTCGAITFGIIFYVFWSIILLSLGFFFVLLFSIVKNKIGNKNERKS